MNYHNNADTIVAKFSATCGSHIRSTFELLCVVELSIDGPCVVSRTSWPSLLAALKMNKTNLELCVELYESPVPL